MSNQFNQQLATKYNARFQNQKMNELQSGPVENRSCKDIICLILFFLIVTAFIGFTIYFLSEGAQNFKGLNEKNNLQKDKDSFGGTFAQTIGIILGMMALSVVISIIFIFLCAKFPKCVVYTGIVVTFLIYAALIVLGIIMKIWALVIGMAVAFLITACIIWCCRNQIQIGIVLLKVSGMFMGQKPQIIVVGFISFIINLIFIIVFILGWISSYSQTLEANNSSEDSRKRFSILMFIYMVMAIFFGYFLYYLMVFVLSTAVSYWYYQQQKSVLYGYCPVNKHLGSITFCSILITFITIMRQLAQRQANQSNGILSIVFCIIACLISCIQGLIRTLNHNAIIVMSITGQSYIDSAKSAAGIIFSNFGLFNIVNFITQFIQLFAIIFCCLIPAFIGGGIIYRKYDQDNTAVVGGVTIFLLSWIITSVIMGVLYQVLSSIFILFCIDKKFRDRGIVAGNIPLEIKDLLYGSSVNTGYKEYGAGTQMRIKQPNNNQPDIYENNNPYHFNNQHQKNYYSNGQPMNQQGYQNQKW